MPLPDVLARVLLVRQLCRHLHGAGSVAASNAKLLLDVLTLKRQDIMMVMMPQLKRATVYFDPSLHKALRVKAAHTDRSVSELVNAAVRQTLAEDANDLAVFADRAKEPALSFEDLLKDMKRRGKL